MSDTAKICTSCDENVTGRKRWKDAAGQYYCDACWQALHAASVEDSNASALVAPVEADDMSLSPKQWRQLRFVTFALCAVVILIVGVISVASWAKSAKQNNAFLLAERAVAATVEKARARATALDFSGADRTARYGKDEIFDDEDLRENEREELVARLQAEISKIKLEQAEYEKKIKQGYAVRDGVLLSPEELAAADARDRERQERENAEAKQRATQLAAEESRRRAQEEYERQQRQDAGQAARAAAAQVQQQQAQQLDAQAMINASTVWMRSWANGGDNTWRPVTSAKLTEYIDGLRQMDTLWAYEQLPLGITHWEARTYVHDPVGKKSRVGVFVRWSTSRGEPREKMMMLGMEKEGGSWKVYSFDW